MIGQVMLAQHSASHVGHGFEADVVALHDGHCDDHQHDDEHKPQDNHDCPECLLTQSLQAAFYNAPVTLSVTVQTEILRPQYYSSARITARYNPNAPRAPPAFLV